MSHFQATHDSLVEIGPYLSGVLTPILIFVLLGPLFVYLWGLSLLTGTPSPVAAQEQSTLVRVIFWSEVETSPTMEIRDRVS